MTVSEQIKTKYRSRVLECRLKAGIAKKKDLAKKAGIPPTILSELESGRLFLSSTYALRLREVLGCSLEDLFELKHQTGVANE
jgi:ribosome-binding protein aMBF1 (putative translation factor)